ncbi:MAG: carboxypeptidase regulatory-like domain-containing protein [Proteobacteria bacterium]|nr:carboxypeptidase regulatory-like domain-containing protein [Pseudomonadota bacterium]
MKSRFLLSHLVALIALVTLLSGCGGGTSTQSGVPTSSGSSSAAASSAVAETSAPPALPTMAARSSTVARGAAAAASSTATATLDLPAGWSLVSFPFSRIEAISGLTHQLYTWRDGAWAALDAAAEPSAVDGRLGYLVYLEAPGRVTVYGERQTADEVAVPLQQGWNLVGNPFDLAISWSWATVSEGDASRAVEAAADGADPLLRASAFGLDKGAPFVETLKTARVAANGARWVFAVQACDLNLVATAASASRKRTAAAGPTGTVVGVVRSSTGANLRNARVSLDSGQSTTSLSDGSFALYNVPAGTRSVTVSLSGYTTARGTITVYANQTRSVYVQLTSTSPGPTTGTLYVRAYTYYYGGVRYYVSKIEVQEYNNYANRWSNSWYYDLGYSSQDLACTGAVVGRGYTVRVTWKNSSGSTFTNQHYVTFSSAGQTDYVYSP